MRLSEILFGRRLSSADARQEEIGPVSGIAILGLDALASAAYGPEAALTVLIPAGALASVYLLPITVVVVLVLLPLFLSYRQTIAAYPSGGGSYTVAKENLGMLPGLLAGSALSIDYILNVAVAISAGVGALVSAVPPLLPYTLPLCLLILSLLVLVNLRGVRTSGLVFMAPTFAFVACLGVTIAAGAVKAVASGGHPAAIVAPTQAGTSGVVYTWLLLRAFASGCTAMTGVEAVSNAVPIFREPRARLARRTLFAIVAILAGLLVGVAWISRTYHIVATPPGQPGYQSVLSQMVGAVAGHGTFYYVTIAAVLTVLALSANTSFAGFPRLCRLLALDGFLPPNFAHRGRRLVYTEGILVLTALSAILIVAFGGITDRLIPLFAVGAFLAFTLSQMGMVVHWHRRLNDRAARHARAINAAGACATGGALVIILLSKFVDGAWLTVIVIPAFVTLFTTIRRYQNRMGEATLETGPLDLAGLIPPIVVVPLRRLDRVSRNAMRFAMTISRDVYAVQVLAEELHTEDLTREWRGVVRDPARQDGYAAPELVLLRSPYRDFFGPFLEWIQRIAAEHPDRPIAVIIPELAHRRWYHFLLSGRATLLKTLLLLHGGPQIIVVNTLWNPPGAAPTQKQSDRRSG
jgi:amino acid transporter